MTDTSAVECDTELHKMFDCAERSAILKPGKPGRVARAMVLIISGKIMDNQAPPRSGNE